MIVKAIMKHPEKWRDTVDPFALPMKNFKLVWLKKQKDTDTFINIIHDYCTVISCAGRFPYGVNLIFQMARSDIGRNYIYACN